jgi:hypothetical protein
LRKAESIEHPLGWGCSLKRRKIAEATHATPEMHAW